MVMLTGLVLILNFHPYPLCFYFLHSHILYIIYFQNSELYWCEEIGTGGYTDAELDNQTLLAKQFLAVL